jgi:hypothetical protein
MRLIKSLQMLNYFVITYGLSTSVDLNYLYLLSPNDPIQTNLKLRNVCSASVLGAMTFVWTKVRISLPLKPSDRFKHR